MEAKQVTLTEAAQSKDIKSSIETVAAKGGLLPHQGEHMNIESMKQAYQVPLVEQLESVPADARLVIDDADGMGTRFIPVGRICREAAAALRTAIEQAEKSQDLKSGIETVAAQGGLLPTREWVGLTLKEFKQLEERHIFVEDTIRFVEAKLKEKNT